MYDFGHRAFSVAAFHKTEAHALIAFSLRVTVRNAILDTPPALPLRIIVVEDNPVDVYLIRWVLTAHSNNPAERRETLAMGADAYFVKPSHLNEFMQLGNPIKHLACDHPK
jgi:hypothetical protein